MQSLYQAIRGTYDILPDEAVSWQKIEQTARDVFRRFCFQEIRTPVFEATELFTRSIGQTTDIVTKEMYTFLDKKARSITLRPEATVCVVRSMIEHAEMFQNLPQRLYYIGPMFRYEKPQSGRNRQFHQIGVEALGSYQPGMDAEVILLLSFLLSSFGLKGVRTEINSVGCPQCRPAYSKELKGYLAVLVKNLCEDCQARYEKNPMRVFDCKNATCIEELKDAPVLLKHICAPCAEHFQKLREILDAAKAEYQMNERLVRGIDYYTKTTFELRHSSLGAQDAIAAGGRYDNLVEELGGPPTGAVGFALGMERVVLAMKNTGALAEASDIEVFVVSLGLEAYLANIAFCQKLRSEGFRVAMDHEGKSMKAQMRLADKMRARHVLIRGEKELKNGVVVLKDMGNGTEQSLGEAQIEQAMAKP